MIIPLKEVFKNEKKKGRYFKSYLRKVGGCMGYINNGMSKNGAHIIVLQVPRKDQVIIGKLYLARIYKSKKTTPTKFFLEHLRSPIIVELKNVSFLEGNIYYKDHYSQVGTKLNQHFLKFKPNITEQEMSEWLEEHKYQRLWYDGKVKIVV